MKKIYFIGINGIGMSGLAKIMKCKGFEVAGADISRSYVTEELEALGITVHSQHDAENVKGFDMIVASSAIKRDNPEYSHALENKMKIVKRGELLALLLNMEVGLAIAGTHGKTTTSSMLGSALMSLDPTIVVGGILPEIGSNSRVGESKYFVAEADESDNSFLYMKPEYSVVTNIEKDHMENHGSLENIKKSFIQFMDQTDKEIIACIDCPTTEELIKGREKVKTYSSRKGADITASDIKVKEGKTYYRVNVLGKDLGEFHLSIPGEHNIQNSLPVIYLADKFGVDTQTLKEAVGKFKGAKRRYDIILDKDIKIIDDYAHHPTEIRATLKGAKSIEARPITAIFQPHRYSRINFLLEEFKGAFNDADEIVILPIYSAGEKNDYGITEEKLLEVVGHDKGKVLKNAEEIREMIENSSEDRVYLFMGAGSISYMAHEIAEKHREEK